MDEPTGVLDPTLCRLAMAVVAEMDATAIEYLQRDGYKYVPRRIRRTVTTYDSGWPNVGGRFLYGANETEAIAYGKLFGFERDALTPLTYTDLESIAPFREYVESTPSIFERVRPLRTASIPDDLFSRMLDYEITSLPASIFDRAKALEIDVDGDDVLELYRLREAEWLSAALSFQLVAPLVLTDIELNGTFEVTGKARIETLRDDDLREMARDYEASGISAPVADAARFAVVIDMPSMANPGPGTRVFGLDEQQGDATDVEDVCEAIRVASSQSTGWARLFVRPVGWAGRWHDDLPELHLVRSARRYPSSFDDFGWLKSGCKITRDEISNLPRVTAALGSADPSTRLAARRLSMAQVRDSPDDELIDACIGLEALLGQKGAELSYRVALRTAVLLSSRQSDPLPPEFAFKMASQVYGRRSDLVHGNTSTKRSTLKLSPEGPAMPTSAVAVLLLRAVLRERLLRGDNWTVGDLDALVLTRLAQLSESPE